MADNGVELLKILNDHYGFKEFRGNQLEGIKAVLRALMENQVDALKARSIPAEFLSSQRSEGDRRQILADIQSNSPRTKLLYVTPELLDTTSFQGVLSKVHKKGNLSLMAIDEAHCISSWGHDFRFSYRKLSRLREFVQIDVPVMALTATATPKVQEDIVSSLQLKNPRILISSFDRPNISYYVELLKEAEKPMPKMIRSLEAGKRDGSWPCAIIYTLKRESADDTAACLQTAGIPCKAYHAGLKASDRSQVLADWTSGVLPVVAATIAFGMGIDKADVRHVYHVNLPKSVEGFYQESGRCGRDGKPAKSVLFYKESDRSFMEWILEKEQKRGKKQKSEATSLTSQQVKAFNKVVGYCVEPRCRRAMLLDHFGERLRQCGGCDYCENPDLAASKLAELTAERSGFKSPARRGKRARTEVYGDGDSEDIGDSGGENALDSPSDSLRASRRAQRESSNQAAEAERVARRAKTEGPSAVLDALEDAEARAEGKGSGGKRQRVLRDSGAITNAPVKIALGAPPVPSEMREKARARLTKALQGNHKFQNRTLSEIESMAEGMEEDCFSTSASKTVYLGRLASAARSASQLSHMTTSASGPRELRNATASGESKDAVRDDLSYRNPVEEVHLGGNNLMVTSSIVETSISRLEELQADFSNDGKEAAELLRRLKNLKVTADLLKSSGLGKRARMLSRSQNPRIASMAAEVIAAWKEQLLSQ